MKNYLKGKKRAVLSIVAKALSVLFGTVTNEDIGSIRKKLGEVTVREQ